MPPGATEASPGRAEPALFGDVEDDPVRILELALEILLLRIISEVEEEGAAGCFDALLGGGEIVDLEAEMMGADEALGVVEPGAALAEIVEEGEVDDAVAQIDRGGKVELLLADPLELENILVEPGGFLKVAHHEREMSKPCHCRFSFFKLSCACARPDWQTTWDPHSP